MKNKLEKLYEELNQFCGDGDNPYTLKKNCIEYDDGTVFITVRWSQVSDGFYYLVSNVNDGMESKKADVMAEKMYNVFMDQHLEKPVWGLYRQFAPLLTNDTYLKVECKTGIAPNKIEDIIMGHKDYSLKRSS